MQRRKLRRSEGAQPWVKPTERVKPTVCTYHPHLEPQSGGKRSPQHIKKPPVIGVDNYCTENKIP